jgi:hypothetical protein
MSQNHNTTIDVEVATGTPIDGCLVCGDDGEVHNYTVSGHDGTAHTIPLCEPHFNLIRRERTAGLEESLDAAETQKITARIPKPLLEDLDERASELEMPRSELIRRCLRDGLVATETDAGLEDFLVAVVESQRRVQRLHRQRRPSGRRAGEDGHEVGGSTDTEQSGQITGDALPDGEIEFLRDRVVHLESLLELALESD